MVNTDLEDMTPDDVFRYLDGDDDICWILVSNDLSECQPSSLDAMCLAVSLATRCQFKVVLSSDPDCSGASDNDKACWRDKSKAMRQLAKSLLAQNDLAFAFLWQVKSEEEPQFEHSQDQTTKEAWDSVLHFLQHDLEWTLGDLVG